MNIVCALLMLIEFLIAWLIFKAVNSGTPRRPDYWLDREDRF